VTGHHLGVTQRSPAEAGGSVAGRSSGTVEGRWCLGRQGWAPVRHSGLAERRLWMQGGPGQLRRLLDHVDADGKEAAEL
jgi:hypothetical protein